MQQGARESAVGRETAERSAAHQTQTAHTQPHCAFTSLPSCSCPAAGDHSRSRDIRNAVVTFSGGLPRLWALKKQQKQFVVSVYESQRQTDFDRMASGNDRHTQRHSLKSNVINADKRKKRFKRLSLWAHCRSIIWTMHCCVRTSCPHGWLLKVGVESNVSFEGSWT